MKLPAALRLSACCALLSLVAHQATSQTNEPALTLERFAQGLQLQTSAGFAMYEFTLPADMYHTVTQPHLADIRVFNASGTVVPHSIRPQADLSSSNEIVHPLRVFPLGKPTANATEQLDIRIETNGTLVQVTRNGTVADAINKNSAHAFLVDLSQFDARIDRLEFDFTASEINPVQKIRIDSGSDLNKWRTLVASASLASLQFGGHALQQNTVALPAYNDKYLRITPVNVGELTIRAVKGIQKSVQSSKPLQTLNAAVSFDFPTNTLRFTTGGPFKLYQAQLQLPFNNMLLEGELYSRATPESPWQFHYSDMFYQLQVQGEQLQNSAINLHGSTDPYWELRLRADNPFTNHGPGDALPNMTFSWLADDLVFLAQGDGPFTVAYGNASVTRTPPPVSSLLNAMDDSQRSLFVGVATAGEPVQLQGATALQVQYQVNWLRFVLWGLLGLGALLAGWMAWRLIKQMQVG